MQHTRAEAEIHSDVVYVVNRITATEYNVKVKRKAIAHATAAVFSKSATLYFRFQSDTCSLYLCLI